MNCLIRADVNPRIGTGHFMRCLALAQALHDEGQRATFAVAEPPLPLATRLREEGVGLVQIDTPLGSAEDAEQTLELARTTGARWIILDGYHFDACYQQTLKQNGKRLLCVDDNGHAERYVADVVLNQNLYANEGLYAKRAPYTHLLLGTRYALLRREFRRLRGWKRSISNHLRKLLVTLGGSDPENVTLKVLRSLLRLKISNLETVVVAGANNPHRVVLERAVSTALSNVEFRHDVTDMVGLMAWADLAIAAGGSTTWELARMGLPSLILVLADNQRPIAEALDKAGVAVNLGWHDSRSELEIATAIAQLTNPERRAQMAQQGQRLVDGRGSVRVVASMMKQGGGAQCVSCS